MEGGVPIGYTLSQNVVTGFAANFIFLPFALFLSYLVHVCISSVMYTYTLRHTAYSKSLERKDRISVFKFLRGILLS